MRGELVRGYCNFCGRSQDASRPSDNQLVLQPGTKLQGGAVTVGALLGKGGFGATYIARSAQDGVIALKEYLPGSLIEPARRGNKISVLHGQEYLFDYNLNAFKKEAELLSKLSHPNIIQVKLSFRENNTLYYGMDLLEGSDLLTFIRARKNIVLRAGTAADLIERIYPVLDAISYLHRRKILHRDISPSNIFLRNWNLDRNSMSFSPCLIDFGAAYADHTDYHKSLTRVKNPHYSPYEQSTTNAMLGPASDVYALCATLYHMLTGVTPQTSMDRMTGGDELVPPSQINPALRPLDHVIMRGMALHVVDRIQSVQEVRQELEKAVYCLRGGKEGKGGRKIDYDRDPVSKSVPALAFDILMPVSVTLLPIVLGGLEAWMTMLSFVFMLALNMLFMLVADGTLGMLIFRLPKRGGSYGSRLLAALLRSLVPYAIVDMILFLCEVYPVPMCNGRPRSGRGEISLPAPPVRNAEYKLVCSYPGPNGKPACYPLQERRIVHIGRAQDNDIVVPDRQGIVSGYHADVYCQDGDVYIKDKSTNGCYFRQQRLKKGVPYIWKEGDWVLVTKNIGFQLRRF